MRRWIHGDGRQNIHQRCKRRKKAGFLVGQEKAQEVGHRGESEGDEGLESVPKSA
jgi:hypothetical protein